MRYILGNSNSRIDAFDVASAILSNFKTIDGSDPVHDDIVFLEGMTTDDSGKPVYNEGMIIEKGSLENVLRNPDDLFFAVNKKTGTYEMMMVVEMGSIKMSGAASAAGRYLYTGTDLNEYCENWLKRNKHFDAPPAEVEEPGWFSNLLAFFGYKTQAYKDYENYQEDSKLYRRQTSLTKIKEAVQKSLDDRKARAAANETAKSETKEGPVNEAPADEKGALDPTGRTATWQGKAKEIQDLINSDKKLTDIQNNSVGKLGEGFDEERTVLTVEIDDYLAEMRKENETRGENEKINIPDITGEDIVNHIRMAYESFEARFEKYQIKVRRENIDKFILNDEKLLGLSTDYAQELFEAPEEARAQMAEMIDEHLAEMQESQKADVPDITGKELVEHICRQYEAKKTAQEVSDMRNGIFSQPEPVKQTVSEPEKTVDEPIPDYTTIKDHRLDDLKARVEEYARRQKEAFEAANARQSEPENTEPVKEQAENSIPQPEKPQTAPETVQQEAPHELTRDEKLAIGYARITAARNAAYETLAKPGATEDEIVDAMATIVATHSSSERSAEVTQKLTEKRYGGSEVDMDYLTKKLAAEKEKREELVLKVAADENKIENMRNSVKSDEGFKAMNRPVKDKDGSGNIIVTSELKKYAAKLNSDNSAESHAADKEVAKLSRESEFTRRISAEKKAIKEKQSRTSEQQQNTKQKTVKSNSKT